jgi:hypothetical protein
MISVFQHWIKVNSNLHASSASPPGKQVYVPTEMGNSWARASMDNSGNTQLFHVSLKNRNMNHLSSNT